VKILLCHNHYQIRAGEDHVFKAEARQLRDHGHQVITYTRDNTEISALSLRRKITAFFFGFYNPRTVADIKEIVAREHPDVAHVHNVFPLISPSVYCTLKKLNVPVVQTIHNFRFFCSNGLLFHNGRACPPSSFHFLRCIFRRCYRNSVVYSAWYAAILLWHRVRKTFQYCIDHYIVLNSFTRTIFIENGFDPARVVIKPNAAEPVPVETGGTYGYAVFIGRLSPEKGAATLLAALKNLSGLTVKIIGSGPLEQEIKEYVDANGLTDIELLGYLPFSECCRHMAHALVMIFPSECYENCPLTVINSLWYGTPVIASRTGGVPDFVPDDAGWLFEPGNADELAAKLQWVIDNKDQVIALRPHAQQWARQQFAPEINYTRLLEIYKKALKSHTT
jgi:glycosyltransferase involved in cell wall biosynthesis